MLDSQLTKQACETTEVHVIKITFQILIHIQIPS